MIRNQSVCFSVPMYPSLFFFFRFQFSRKDESCVKAISTLIECSFGFVLSKLKNTNTI